MAVLLSIALTAFAALVVFILLKRRNIPAFDIANPDGLGIGELLPALAGVTRSTLYHGNEVAVLQDTEMFAAMFEDMQAAAETIHLETFVWSDGDLAEEVTRRLAARAAAGVAVRLLVDAVGAGAASAECFDRMRAAGVEIGVYRPLRPWNVLKMNHRTHRKLFIVDGRIGYCFGHGIGDEWYRPGPGGRCWRDTGVRVRGPAVTGLQQAFFHNWMEVTHQAPLVPSLFPEPAAAGDADMHIVSSAPGDSFSDVALIFMLAMAAAQRSILLQNPYFVPDDGMLGWLQEAARRGVRVRLMLPGGRTDSPFVAAAGRHLYAGLVEAGVELYEYQPTLSHQGR